MTLSHPSLLLPLLAFQVSLPGCIAAYAMPSVARARVPHMMATRPPRAPEQTGGTGGTGKREVILEDTTASTATGDKRKQIAKARRAVSAEGKGGMKIGRTKKRTEQKKATSGKGFDKSIGGLNYNRAPTATDICACGIGAEYGDCCGPEHAGTRAAETPEALIRARYTAFRYRLPDYLISTTHPDGEEWQGEDQAMWKKGLLGFCDDFEFQGLTVDDVAVDSDADGEAEVGFRANICQKGTLNLMGLREISTVRKSEDGRWLYWKGDTTYENPQ